MNRILEIFWEINKLYRISIEVSSLDLLVVQQKEKLCDLIQRFMHEKVKTVHKEYTSRSMMEAYLSFDTECLSGMFEYEEPMELWVIAAVGTKIYKTGDWVAITKKVVSDKLRVDNEIVIKSNTSKVIYSLYDEFCKYCCVQNAMFTQPKYFCQCFGTREKVFYYADRRLSRCIVELYEVMQYIRSNHISID